MPPTKSARSNTAGLPLGFEAKLCLATDELRNNINAAEYKHVVLGLIFLKYIHHSVPQGMAGFVFANGSMSSNQSGEKETWLSS